MDILCASAQLCARSAGGNNAGHTICAFGKKYDFHILPSGLVNPKCMNLIGSGVVIHIPSFFRELEDNKALNTEGRIFISDRAQVVFDLLQIVDGLEEQELGKGAVGTTKKGIGPGYSCKAARSGVRVAEIFYKEILDRKLRTLAANYRKRYGELFDAQGYDVEEEIARFDDYRNRLPPFVVDAVAMINEMSSNNSASLLVEGANALMLDVDYGTYPYVTSSNAGLGGVFTGLALSPFDIKQIIGVVKAYTTRVGGGPMPTEQLNTNGEKLQSIGKEFGVTTGRSRRCGWLDLVIVKYSTNINHYTALNLTKLDVLDDFPEILVATAYEIDGTVLPYFPADLEALARTKVIYKSMPGWNSSTTGVKEWSDLPENARKYIEFIEGFVGVKCKWIGTGKYLSCRYLQIVSINTRVSGPEREHMIHR